MKSLMLAPIPAWSVITGKLLAGLINGLIAAIFIVFGLMMLELANTPIQFATVMVLLLLVFVSLGVAAREYITFSVNCDTFVALGLPMFFISGAFSPISWSTPASAAIAPIIPRCLC